MKREIRLTEGDITVVFIDVERAIRGIRLVFRRPQAIANSANMPNVAGERLARQRRIAGQDARDRPGGEEYMYTVNSRAGVVSKLNGADVPHSNGHKFPGCLDARVR